MDATFEGKDPRLRAVYDAVIGHLRTLGDVHEDAVKVGVFLKRDDKLAELRPRSRDLLVYLFLPYPIETDRITRPSWSRGESRVAHRLSLREVSDVDAEVCEWLTLAYEFAGSEE